MCIALTKLGKKCKKHGKPYCHLHAVENEVESEVEIVVEIESDYLESEWETESEDDDYNWCEEHLNNEDLQGLMSTNISCKLLYFTHEEDDKKFLSYKKIDSTFEELINELDLNEINFNIVLSPSYSKYVILDPYNLAFEKKVLLFSTSLNDIINKYIERNSLLD